MSATSSPWPLPTGSPRKEMRPSSNAQSVLLVDDIPFFRNMLAPVLKAAGYKVRDRAERAGSPCGPALGSGL